MARIVVAVSLAGSALAGCGGGSHAANDVTTQRTASTETATSTARTTSTAPGTGAARTMSTVSTVSTTATAGTVPRGDLVRLDRAITTFDRDAHDPAHAAADATSTAGMLTSMAAQVNGPAGEMLAEASTAWTRLSDALLKSDQEKISGWISRVQTLDKKLGR